MKAPPTSPPPSVRRRAFEGLTRTVIATVVAVVVAYSLQQHVNELLVALRDGQWPNWLLVLARDIASNTAVAAAILVVVVPGLNLAPPSGWQRWVVLAAALAVGTLAGSLARLAYVHLAGLANPAVANLERLQIYALRYGWPTGLLMVVAEFYWREVRSVESMHAAELDRLQLDRQMAEARLQVLQAQIEPHFLFNTLANVRRLYQTEPGTARHMLDNLMRYLEVALPRMRDSSSTLEREASLIEAFLNVQQIRMGRRLSFEIDIPPTLGTTSVPPMMLLTLVENALKHGLTPLPEGGFIRVAATVQAGELELSVADTGRGFGAGTSGGGTGLANIRARLSAVYGARASLELRANTPRGITAHIRLPVAS